MTANAPVSKVVLRARRAARWFATMTVAMIAVGIALNIGIGRASRRAVADAQARRAESFAEVERANRMAADHLRTGSIGVIEVGERQAAANAKWTADSAAIGTELSSRLQRLNAWSRVVVLLWFGPLMLALFCLLIWFPLRLRAAALRGELAARGYEWMTVEGAFWLLVALRGRAVGLPPAADVETIPGIERSIDGLVAYDRMRRRHRVGRPVPDA